LTAWQTSDTIVNKQHYITKKQHDYYKNTTYRGTFIVQHQLAFREDRTFTITQFTDLHWENGGDEDQQTRRLMEEVLDSERPDLVVFTGDVIYTGASGEPVCKHPHQAFRDAVHSAESRGIPWAVVFGNHDTETTITRDELMHTVLEHSHTVTQRGPKEINGVGNYTLSISGPDGQTAAALYFFDSGDRSALPHIQGYDWIRSNQIDWYREESRKPWLSFTSRFRNINKFGRMRRAMATSLRTSAALPLTQVCLQLWLRWAISSEPSAATTTSTIIGVSFTEYVSATEEQQVTIPMAKTASLVVPG
jgi:hypothetical protein